MNEWKVVKNKYDESALNHRNLQIRSGAFFQTPCTKHWSQSFFLRKTSTCTLIKWISLKVLYCWSGSYEYDCQTPEAGYGPAPPVLIHKDRPSCSVHAPKLPKVRSIHASPLTKGWHSRLINPLHIHLLLFMLSLSDILNFVAMVPQVFDYFHACPFFNVLFLHVRQHLSGLAIMIVKVPAQRTNVCSIWCIL